MTIKIGSNTAALRATRQLQESSTRLASTYDRLSSGRRINRTADDAAGLSVASGINAQRRVYKQELRNANDALSMLNIADGASRQLGDVLTRIRELATQAANGSLSSSQRSSLNTEAAQLIKEYNRIISSTSFNGSNILGANRGTTSTQLGYGSDELIGTDTSGGLSRSVGSGQFTGNLSNLGGASAGLQVADFDSDGYIDAAVGNSAGNSISLYRGSSAGLASAGTVTVAGGLSTFAVGDLNGDGRPDIITANSADGKVFQLNNQGSFAFSAAVNVFSLAGAGLFGAYDLAIGDVNGDGAADVALTGTGVAGGIAVYSNRGGGSYNLLFQNSTFTATGVEIGDLDGDGKGEVVAKIGSATAARVYRSSGSTLSLAYSLTLGSNGDGIDQIAIGDFDYDGIKDLAFNTGKVELFKGSENYSTARAASSS